MADEPKHYVGYSIVAWLLALLVTCGFFAIIFFVLFHGMPQQGTEALLMLLGTVGTAWTTVIQYFFGQNGKSSNGNGNGNGKPPEATKITMPSSAPRSGNPPDNFP